MNKTHRRSRSLVGAVALVSSALLATSSVAVAGKPDPVVTARSGSCDERVLGTTSTTTYRVQYDLTANKGRWLYATAELTIESNDYGTSLDPSERIDKKANLQVQARVEGPPQSATMVLQFLDRQGAPLGAAHEYGLVPPDCIP
ncbi:MAG: hypothetical protein PVG27_13865 [Chloroflexota bacterium]|jgi:hypothetical protein